MFVVAAAPASPLDSAEPGKPKAGDSAASRWSPDPDQVRRWTDFCLSKAKDYEITSADAAQEKFKLLPAPIFRHGVTGRTTGPMAVGPVVLWVREDGRPAVICDMFCAPYPMADDYMMVHEFHSLADGPLSLVLHGQRLWSPGQAGLKWRLLPDAQVPADSAAGRLRQAKELARCFEGHGIDAAGGRYQFRILPQPVYHYETNRNEPAGTGAVFLACEGTDPEIILNLDIRQSPDGPRWHYAAASFSDWELHLALDRAEVWSAPRNDLGNRNGPHWSIVFRVPTPP
jgi:hypothetical protein